MFGYSLHPIEEANTVARHTHIHENQKLGTTMVMMGK